MLRIRSWRFFLKDRIKAIIDHLGISQSEFAKRAHISTGRLSDLLSGRVKSLSAEAIASVHRAFSVDTNWLLTGEGKMFHTATRPQHLDDIVEGQIIPPTSAPSDDLPEGWIAVDSLPKIVLRYYPGGIPAGPLDLADDYYELVQVPMTGAVGPGCIMIRVRGNSMIGAGIYDNDIMCVDTGKRHPENGDVVVVTVDGESTVKYWYQDGDRVILCPDSELHDPIDVTGREIIVNGTVTEVKRFVKKGKPMPKNGNGNGK